MSVHHGFVMSPQPEANSHFVRIIAFIVEKIFKKTLWINII